MYNMLSKHINYEHFLFTQLKQMHSKNEINNTFSEKLRYLKKRKLRKGKHPARAGHDRLNEKKVSDMSTYERQTCK
ncbi:hypothetical protein QTP88_022221 [Uroleucon formosanum]